jgi:hypothetical protein
MTLVGALVAETDFDFSWFIVVDCSMLEDRADEFLAAIEDITGEPAWDTGFANVRGLLQVTAIPLQSGTLTLRFEAHDTQPDIDLDQWQYVAEGLLVAPSGCVTATHPPRLSPTVRFQVSPGRYGARIAGRGFERARVEPPHALEYAIWLWPQGQRNARLLKAPRG